MGSQKTSNCSNSLNFEAKIKCNTIKPNVPKWRKTCTGLKFDLLDFHGLRAIYILFEIPVFFGPPCICAMKNQIRKRRRSRLEIEKIISDLLVALALSMLTAS